MTEHRWIEVQNIGDHDVEVRWMEPDSGVDQFIKFIRPREQAFIRENSHVSEPELLKIIEY